MTIKVRMKIKPRIKAAPAPVIETAVDEFDAGGLEDFSDDLDMKFDDDFGDDGFDDFGSDEDFSEAASYSATVFSREWPCVPVEIAHRVIEACELSSVPVDYYIDRYCRKLTIAERPEFSSRYLDLMNRDRRNY